MQEEKKLPSKEEVLKRLEFDEGEVLPTRQKIEEPKEPQEIVKVIHPKDKTIIIDLSTPEKAEKTRCRLLEDGQCFIEPGRTCLLPTGIRKIHDFSNYCRACVDRINAIQIVQMQTAAMGGMAKLTGAVAQKMSQEISRGE